MVLAPRGPALSALLSPCSVLDDEGSNLRQQKLDRQVSEAGAGWEGGQHAPSRPESGWGLQGRGVGEQSSFLGDPVWWREGALPGEKW